LHEDLAIAALVFLTFTFTVLAVPSLVVRSRPVDIANATYERIELEACLSVGLRNVK